MSPYFFSLGMRRIQFVNNRRSSLTDNTFLAMVIVVFSMALAFGAHSNSFWLIGVAGTLAITLIMDALLEEVPPESRSHVHTVWNWYMAGVRFFGTCLRICLIFGLLGIVGWAMIDLGYGGFSILFGGQYPELVPEGIGDWIIMLVISVIGVLIGLGFLLGLIRIATNDLTDMLRRIRSKRSGSRS